MTKADAQYGSPGRGQATRGRILAAAEALVAEAGWGSVTTRAVAARAGVNQGLVHYHFASLDGLLRAAVVAGVDAELAAELQRFDLASPSGILFSEALLRAARDPAMAQSVGAILVRFRGRLADRLAGAQAAGELAAGVDPRNAATALAGLYDGLLLHRIAEPGTDLAAAADVVLGRLFDTGGPVAGGARPGDRSGGAR